MPPRKRAAPPETPRIHPELAAAAVAIDTLVPYYKNPNVGLVPEIRLSLRRNGQYKRITVNAGTHTGRKSEILAGNHTWQAAREEGWPDIAVEWIDVDEKTAARIVVGDNELAAKAKRDPDALAEVLGLMDGDFEGIGLTEAELENLLAEDSAGEGEGGEQDASPKLKDAYSILVECRDEEQQLDLLEKFEAEGLTCRPLMM